MKYFATLINMEKLNYISKLCTLTAKTFANPHLVEKETKANTGIVINDTETPSKTTTETPIVREAQVIPSYPDPNSFPGDRSLLSDPRGFPPVALKNSTY